MTIDFAKIITSHPGGYPDILDALRRHSLTPVGYTKTAIHANKTVTESLATNGGEILAEIEKELIVQQTANVSGLIAGSIQSILAKYDLPTPGDKRWLTPAEMWFT